MEVIAISPIAQVITNNGIIIIIINKDSNHTIIIIIIIIITTTIILKATIRIRLNKVIEALSKEITLSGTTQTTTITIIITIIPELIRITARRCYISKRLNQDNSTCQC